MISKHNQHVFETCCKDDKLQRDLPRSHFYETLDQGKNFQRTNPLNIWKIYRLFEQLFKAIYEVTASTNTDCLSWLLVKMLLSQ